DNATVQVASGAIATNTGKWSGARLADTITVTAKPGNIVQGGTMHGNGLWSWSLNTGGLPAQTTTVSISASDGHGGIATTTFSLVITKNSTTTALTSSA